MEENISFDLLPEQDEYFVSSARDLNRYIASGKNKNTTKKTESSIRKFKDFILSVGMPAEKEVTSYTPFQLDTLIGNWVFSLEKEDGGMYEPDSLSSMYRGVDRYLREKDYEHDILKDPEFSKSREALRMKRKQLKAQGLGNRKNAAEALTYDDEEGMWTSGSLGTNDPDVLQQTVWYVISKSLGYRGCQEARQLCYGDLEERRTEEGETDYFEWTEKISKTRQGNTSSRPFNPKLFPLPSNPDRCPVMILKEFLRRRPEAMKKEDSPFFIQVNRSRRPTDTVWYKSQPLGTNTLGKFMRLLAGRAGISAERRITNHSVRKTCCTRLLGAGVPDTAVAQLSGHKNLASLNTYNVLNLDQQRAMSRVLNENIRGDPNALPGSRKLCLGPTNPRPSTSAEGNPRNALPPPPEPEQENDSDTNHHRGQPVVFNISNTAGGSVQIVYGEKPNLAKISNQENEIKQSQSIHQEPEAKRRRILPLCYSSSSDSDFE